MENETLEKIKMFAIKLLQAECGYCGVMDSPKVVVLNSELSDGQDVKITIEIKE